MFIYRYWLVSNNIVLKSGMLYEASPSIIFKYFFILMSIKPFKKIHLFNKLLAFVIKTV